MKLTFSFVRHALRVSYLILVVVFSVDHHGLESVSPEYLVGQVGGPGLEGHAARLDRALQGHVQLELVSGQLGGRQSLNVITVFVKVKF